MKTHPVRTIFVAITFLFASSISMASADRHSQIPKLKFSRLTTELDTPWSLVELPSGDILVTERGGQLQHLRNGKLTTISGTPEVYYAGQGGLLDIKLHPNYEHNGWLYLSYAAGDKKQNALRLMRAKLQNNTLVNQQELFTAEPYKDTPVHYAGRISFLPDNTLLLNIGDGFDYRESAQKKDSLLGKIVRLTDEGNIPEDNPFISEQKTHKAIYSLGHRNPQGLVYDKKRKLIFSNEHGPAGGDEINIIRAGHNYDLKQ